jgi:hypothetical protein
LFHRIARPVIFLVLSSFLIPSALWADPTDAEARIQALEEQVSFMRDELDEQELERLRSAASSEAAADAEEALEERSYVTASRSLQMLNPEISVSGDVVGSFIAREGLYADEGDRSGMPVRALDMHIQSSLDPFSVTKMAIGFDPAGAVLLEELYITWNGLIPSLSISVGRFRQLIGVVNRWHEHDLDQVTYPMAVTSLLGEAGLTQQGVSLRWMMPALIAHANELTLEVTDGCSEALFAGEHFSVPATLLHLKNYYDLSEDTYLEMGLSGQFGFNNRRGIPNPDGAGVLVDEPWRQTWVAAADLTLHWEPLKQARYRSVTWRSEGFWVQKETPTGDATGWGGYSYLQYQLSAAWFAGLRGDLVEPLNTGGADLDWDAVAYVTFWQSEFVYLRLQGQHGRLAGEPDTRVLLQLNWAAGPHRHEKY